MVAMRGGRSQAPKVGLATLLGAYGLILLILMVSFPVDAGSQEAERQRYRGEFMSATRGASPSTIGTLYWNGEVSELTVGEMADIYAARAMARDPVGESQKKGAPGSDDSRRADSRGSEKTTSSDGPIVLGVGALGLHEILHTYGQNPSVACSDLAQNQHYTVAFPFAEGQYAGLAFSDVSAHAGGLGTLTDRYTGQEQVYNKEIYYGGVTDFFCTEISRGGVHTIINNPEILAGFVIGATD